MDKEGKKNIQSEEEEKNKEGEGKYMWKRKVLGPWKNKKRMEKENEENIWKKNKYLVCTGEEKGGKHLLCRGGGERKRS